MESKQTAVEYLEQIYLTTGIHRDIHFRQAKEMEKEQQGYSEADIREAYFTAIKSTGEGWNGEYAGGNLPNIEKKFKEGFEIFIEQYKNK